MKRLVDYFYITDADFRVQVAVDRIPELCGWEIPLQHEAGDLPESMHASVSASSAVHRNVPVIEQRNDSSQFALYSSPFRLDLPALVAGTVVFDDNFVVPHD